MPLSMFMGIQMIRTILIVALTFGAKTKFQIAIQFCTAADGTLMPGGPGPFLYFMPEYLPSADLLVARKKITRFISEAPIIIRPAIPL